MSWRRARWLTDTARPRLPRPTHPTSLTLTLRDLPVRGHSLLHNMRHNIRHSQSRSNPRIYPASAGTWRGPFRAVAWVTRPTRPTRPQGLGFIRRDAPRSHLIPNARCRRLLRRTVGTTCALRSCPSRPIRPIADHCPRRHPENPEDTSCHDACIDTGPRLWCPRPDSNQKFNDIFFKYLDFITG